MGHTVMSQVLDHSHAERLTEQVHSIIRMQSGLLSQSGQLYRTAVLLSEQSHQLLGLTEFMDPDLVLNFRIRT